MSRSKLYFVAAFAILVVIVGIVVVHAIFRAPGLDKPIKVQDGSVQVKTIERVDSFEAPNGQKVTPDKADQFVLIDVNVEGTVPLAGTGSGSQEGLQKTL